MFSQIAQVKEDNVSEIDQLEGIKTYANQLKVPVWIMHADSGKIVYANQHSDLLFDVFEDKDSGRNHFESTLCEKINESLRKSSFFTFNLDITEKRKGHSFRLNGNKLNESYFAVSLLDRELNTNEGFDPGTHIFFCKLNGDLLKQGVDSNKNKFSSLSNITEFFSEKDRVQIQTALEEIGKGKDKYLISEINVQIDGSIQLCNVEFINPGENIEFIAVILSDTFLKNELILEKSRAELAEEINKILKLEIEEHKNTQRKLDDSEILYSCIIDSSMNIVITFDKEMRVTEFNHKAEMLIGYGRSEAIGMNVNEILENNGDVENVMMVVNSSGSYQGEMVCKRKSGDKFGVVASVTVLHNKKGSFLGYVSSMRDSTDLKKLQSKYAITEERYTDLFENATDLIQGVNIDGSFLYTNKSWYKHLGYTKTDREELSVFDLLDSKNRKEYRAHFKKIISGEKTQRRIWTLQKKDGEKLIVESISNLKLLDGKPHAVRSIMRDVTEAVKAKNLAEERRAKMEAIIESGNIMFWTVNRSIKLTSFNNEYAKTIHTLYGKGPKLDAGKHLPKDKFAPNEYHDFWAKKYNEVFRTGQNIYFQTKTKDTSGKIYFREIFLKPLFSPKGLVVEVSGIGIDITEKMLSERKVNEQASKIKTIFDSTNQIIWSFDTEGILTSFNKVMKYELKQRYNIDIKLGQSGIEISRKIKIVSDHKWEDIKKQILKGKKIQFEVESFDRNKKKYIEDISISPIYNADNEIVEMAGIAQNVTFKRASERKLKEQAAKISAIFDSTAMLIWTVDKNMRIVAFNKVFGDEHFKLLGKEMSIGSNFVELMQDYIAKDGHKILKDYFKEAFKGNNQQFEGMLHSIDGRKVWMEVFLNPIYSENNEIKEISCLSHDITEKKRIQEQMRETINEKEILLQEVHHRVKNNLQVISSILNLQSSYVKDENSLSILRESQNRIKSMSFIHESLYQTKDFAHIEFREYLLSLSKNLIHSYSLSTNKITLNTNLCETFLSLDQAIPCGLIVNELISNSLKYAFENDKSGEIFITLEENKNILTLVIGDDGIGLPPGFDYENSESLGLQLVYTLIDQIDATIKVETTNGTKYLITFEKQ